VRPVVWQHREYLPRPPAEAYQLFADTDRFSRLRGGKPLTIEEQPVANGEVQRLIRAGDGNPYIEEPFEWEEGVSFSVRRHYRTGLIASYDWSISFEPDGDGTTLHFRGAFYVRSLLGRVAMLIFTRLALRPQVHAAFAKVRKSSAERIVAPAALPETIHERRLERARETLVRATGQPRVVDKLIAVIREETDIELLHLKPLELAQRWKVDADAVVAAFLRGTREGFFELRWSLICPSCRGAKGETDNLSRLRLEAHCDSCNIEFDSDFGNSVQVTFRPAPTLRRLDASYFCVGGPLRTPHIRAQRNIDAGNTVDLTSDWVDDLEQPRLRCPVLFKELPISAAGTYVLGDDGFELEAASQTLSVRNATDRDLRVVFEDEAFVSPVLTGAAVAGSKLFRDLFSDQLLAPEMALELRPLAFLFTDLRGSTALYEATGDAAAFAKVRAHFVVLLASLEAHRGNLVKTIGDAVMATFEDPADAMRCAIAMQRGIAEAGEVTIKIGVHYGRAMAVTLNERADFFGATVNRAARLEGQGAGGDIVCSRRVYDDPAVQELLADGGFELAHEEVAVKGIEAPMPIVRVQVL
jgi:class 3 adenylate cyclase